ncbi:MAG TPA: peptidyl-prolyl cis-trans isomerase [Pirellulales bacterium]|nr:peptidyl-prolyl cis-trans isomerase [Pirellulales bacterium]
MSRLFYPILFTLTAALATTLWMRHGLSTHWLGVLDAAAAQAQPPVPNGGPAPPPNGGFAPPPWNGPNTGATTQRLPSATQRPLAGQPAVGQPAPGPLNGRPPVAASRARQAPYTQLRLDSGGLEITQPIPVVGAQIVGRVGNEIILAADVLPQVNEEFRQTARGAPKEQHEFIFTMLMARQVKQLAQMKLVFLEMKANIPDDKVADTKKQILSHFEKVALPGLLERHKVKTVTELEAKLKEHGSSLAKEKEKFFEQALVSEWLRKEVKFDEHVSHEELLKYYHEHLTEYEFKAKARFEEIRVSYGKKRRSRHDAWQVIRGLADRVFAGAPMAELAKTHSEGLKAEDGGLHDWTNQGSLACKPLDAALFSLPVGALSNIIDDEKGAFLVVRVLERTPAGVTSFREAQAGIRGKIRAQREQAARAKTLIAFMEKNKFRAWTIYDDMLREAEEKAKSVAKKPGPVASRLR